MSKADRDFSKRLLNWYDIHGRTTLPWQQDRDPYKIWLSEIMLQQTQVDTVIPYYQKFLSRFPDISALANAGEDEVLHFWSGLGYYARARNLHKAAKIIRDDFRGEFPDRFDEVINLPGIGRSTAGAILCFCMNQRHPILDGNVKRVLTRYYAITGYPGKRDVEQTLWDIADRLTPMDRVPAYTQAIMDLGATVCTRSPKCGACPLQTGCVALRLKKQAGFPQRKPKTCRAQKSVTMLAIKNNDARYLMVKRPPAGIWGGLWCLPQMADTSLPIPQWCYHELGLSVEVVHKLPMVRHGFTHFDLEIHPRLCAANGSREIMMDKQRYLWYDTVNPPNIGLPAVIGKIFATLGIG